MRLSTKGRTAVIAMMELAIRQGQGQVNLRELATSQGISVSYIEQIFARLRRHELVVATAWRGPLAKSASQRSSRPWKNRCQGLMQVSRGHSPMRRMSSFMTCGVDSAGRSTTFWMASRWRNSSNDPDCGQWRGPGTPARTHAVRHLDDDGNL